jgi:hypothetical protein
MNADCAELVKITSRVIDNASREARGIWIKIHLNPKTTCRNLFLVEG